jgi:hypothetical protein
MKQTQGLYPAPLKILEVCIFNNVHFPGIRPPLKLFNFIIFCNFLKVIEVSVLQFQTQGLFSAPLRFSRLVPFPGMQAPFKYNNISFFKSRLLFVMMCRFPEYNPLLNIFFSFQVIRAGLDHGQAEGYKAGDHLDFYY